MLRRHAATECSLQWLQSQMYSLFLHTGRLYSLHTTIPGSWHDSTVAQDLINMWFMHFVSINDSLDQGWPTWEICWSYVKENEKEIVTRTCWVLNPYAWEIHITKTSIGVGYARFTSNFFKIKEQDDIWLKEKTVLYCCIIFESSKIQMMGLNLQSAVWSIHQSRFLW